MPELPQMTIACCPAIARPCASRREPLAAVASPRPKARTGSTRMIASRFMPTACRPAEARLLDLNQPWMPGRPAHARFRPEPSSPAGRSRTGGPLSRLAVAIWSRGSCLLCTPGQGCWTQEFSGCCMLRVRWEQSPFSSGMSVVTGVLPACFARHAVSSVAVPKPCRSIDQVDILAIRHVGPIWLIPIIEDLCASPTAVARCLAGSACFGPVWHRARSPEP